MGNAESTGENRSAGEMGILGEGDSGGGTPPFHDTGGRTWFVGRRVWKIAMKKKGWRVGVGYVGDFC